MKKIISLATVLLILASRSLSADINAERQALDRKQAVLTRQLSVAEKLAATHGRYVVVRDLYLNGTDGLNPATAKLFGDIDAWLKNWEKGLKPLALGEWIKQLEDPKFMQFTQSQAIEMETIAAHYKSLRGLADKGYDIASALPRIRLDEFRKEKERGFGDGVFLDAFASNVAFFNQQLDELTGTFDESIKLLGNPQYAATISSMRKLSNDIYLNLRFLNSLKKMNYPELSSRIDAVEKMLATEKALEPVIAAGTRLFKEGLFQSADADFITAEKTVGYMQQHQSYAFKKYDNPAYDKQRVDQAKALLTMQLKDLQNNLNIKIASEGGRAEALRGFIGRKSYGTVVNPADYCRSYDEALSEYRHHFDCNLFRTGVAPFLSQLSAINEGLLEQIAQNLNHVYKGPLSKGDNR